MRRSLIGFGIATTFAAAASSYGVSASLIMLDEFANDVTVDSNGVTLVLAGAVETFIYSSADCYTNPMSIGQGSGNAISAEGTAVAGQAEFDGQSQAARWTASGGWEAIGNLGATGSGSCQQSNAYGITPDGSTAVGLAWADICSSRGFSWTSATSIEGLDVAAGGNSGYRANSISAGGSIIVGFAVGETVSRSPIIWNADGSVAFYNGDIAAEFVGMTPDGSTIVGGAIAGPAFFYTEAGGFVSIGALAGDSVATAIDVSADVSRIVGSSGSFFDGPEAIIWTADTGLVRLEQYLTDLGVTIPVGVLLTTAQAITDDGKTVVGVAVGGGFSGFIATLPDVVPDPCPTDLDGDGAVGFSDLTMVLSSWGPCACPAGCPEDFSCDGQIGFADLTTLLNAWGPC